MTNFSPFFPGSEGLVTPAGLELSLADSVAAHENPRIKRKTIEMTKEMRIVGFLDTDFMVPPIEKMAKNLAYPFRFAKGLQSLSFLETCNFKVLGNLKGRM